jgi:hypothetical protein
VVLSQHLASIDTGFKPSAVLSDFSLDDQDRVSENATYRLCIRRDTGVVYALRRASTNLGSAIRERSILEALKEESVPFVAHLQWAFQDGEHSYWVIVSHAFDFTFEQPSSHIQDHHDRGSLFEYVKRHGILDSVRAALYASEVVCPPVDWPSLFD